MRDLRCFPAGRAADRAVFRRREEEVCGGRVVRFGRFWLVLVDVGWFFGFGFGFWLVLVVFGWFG